MATSSAHSVADNSVSLANVPNRHAYIQLVVCRFLRLAKGGRKVALTDFQSVPELAGNPFIMRIFELFDADHDGCLNFEEFIRAVESFGRLYTSDDKCMCKDAQQKP